MRKIANFASKAEAERFRWFLHSNQIACHHSDDDSEAGGGGDDGLGKEEIWILDDDDVKRARELHEQYLLNPTAAPFASMIAEAKRSFTKAEKAAKKQQTRAPRPPQAGWMGAFPLTLMLIAISGLIFTLGFFGQPANNAATKIAVLKLLRFSLYAGTSFIEIRHGEIWRLFTPMFLHEGMLHIFFNMMWLWMLGRQVEANEGSLKLLTLVLVICASSHSAFYLVAGPNFGGMSGVNYGLATYIWCMDQWGGHHSYRSDPSQSQFFLVWYIACLVLTLFGMRVANTIHGVGALAGFIVAFISCRRYKKMRQFFQASSAGKQTAIGIALLAAGLFIDSLTY